MIAVLTFLVLCGLCATAFLCWCIWDLCWSLYDAWLQERTRARNNRFQARSSRDCFRDYKGTTK